MRKYIDLHLHALDQFDSPNTPKRVCERMKELNAPGFALTQHGMLAGIEPMRTECEKYGLKLIPGIETYYGNADDIMKNQHLLLLATDAIGYKAICLAVSDKESQNDSGFSVMSEDILRRYFGRGALGHGHVIATSACIQGPLASIIRQNEVVDNEIEKLTRKYRGISDQSSRITSTEEKLNDLSKEIEEAKKKRDEIKKLAETKFQAREKYVKKLLDKNDPAYEGERLSLDEDKRLAENAKEELEEVKKTLTQMLRSQTALKQELKSLSEEQERFNLWATKKKEILSRKISEDEMQVSLMDTADKLLRLFGSENFYIEIQNHGIDLEKLVYPKLVSLARKSGIPLVATNDVHLAVKSPDERLQRQIFRSLRFGESWEEENVGDSELFIKTDEEMEECLRRLFSEDVVKEAMSNTLKIFDRCNVIFENGKHYPKFPSEKGKSADEMLDEAIQKGIRWRFPTGLDKEHEERLRKEVDTIKKMGYSDYHLIVKDFLDYGRVLASYPADEIETAPKTIKEAKTFAFQNGWSGGISIGPGRGSAVGSLVCYLLGITSMDPIKYNLLFERFLNPERVSMPDIDTDLSKTVRQQVIRYVRNKYGEDSVCGILTTNALAPKGAIRTAAKYYGLKKRQDGMVFKALGDSMAKMVPKEPGTSFDSEHVSEKTLYESLKDMYRDNEDALEILRWAKILEGSFTTYGAHAAGIVISDSAPVREYIPLRWNKKLNLLTTQCDMQYVEEKGLLKMDFLGLKTLDIINDCIKMVFQRTGKMIDPNQINLEDERVFRTIFQKGNTNSVFQFESAGMKNMLQRFKPSSFEDLIILVSMFRPGPIQYIDDVIEVKHGRKAPAYITPELKDILGRTYGGIVYQEQVMEIFQKLAGYTLGGADSVRRFMSKKKMDKLVHERSSFIHGDAERNIEGCVRRGIKEKAANELFDQMTEFAKYAFNRSHAAAYALIAYWTGWLKCYYPAEFLAAAMNWAENDDDLRGLMREAKTFNVKVHAPDVNLSGAEYTVSSGEILFSLSAIKMVGDNGREIVEERKKRGNYTSLKNFFLRAKVKRNAVDNLIMAGAMDGFCRNRMAMRAVVDVYKDLTKKYHAKEESLTGYLKLLKHYDNIKDDSTLAETQKSLNINVLDKYIPKEKLEQKVLAAKKALAEIDEQISCIILDLDTFEDPLERLNSEREMLGSYVTGHPLDEYELDQHEITPLADLRADSTYIAGIATNISLKKRKKDGRTMAFFTLEDKTGSIDVSVFTTAYDKYGSMIVDGKVIGIRGNVVEEESGTEDENGLPIIEKRFIAESISPVSPSKRLIMAVSSYALWHVTEEEAFKKKYYNPDGNRFAVYDEALDVIRPITYRVDERAENLPGII